jgi:hypothetical protein
MRIIYPSAIRLLLSSVLLLGWASNSYAESYFVTVVLPHGVRVDLPKNWKAVSRNEMVTIGAAIESSLSKVSVVDASSRMDYMANLYDEANKVSSAMNIRYYPEMPVSQETVRAFTLADIQGVDAILHEQVSKGIAAIGATILDWHGTKMVTVNGYATLLTEYKRSPINNNGVFVVRLARVINGSKSFTITVSYRENQNLLLRPICDKIIASIHP